MSLPLALVSTAISAAAGFASLFNGSAPLVLGDMVFQGFELPEKITHGGTQMLTVHKYPGGGRTIDAMGDDESDISWSGIFLGPLAQARSAQLEQMRTDGDVLPLAWGEYIFTVVVKDVTCDAFSHRSEYRITCTILPDPPPDDDPEGDDGSTGPGEPPANPSAAETRGSAGLARATTARTPDLPTPPIPPATIPAGQTAPT